MKLCESIFGSSSEESDNEDDAAGNPLPCSISRIRDSSGLSSLTYSEFERGRFRTSTVLGVSPEEDIVIADPDSDVDDDFFHDGRK